MTILLSPDWLAGDFGKLTLFIGAIVGLFLLMKLIGRWTKPTDSFHAAASRPNVPVENDDDPPIINEDGSLHPDYTDAPMFGDFELSRISFRETDELAGPADPFDFCDELTVEFRNRETRGMLERVYTVGTPAGFVRMLETNGWESFYSPNVLVVRKFRPNAIRKMILEQFAQDETGIFGKKNELGSDS